jgi:hypothetical protein
MVLFIFLGWQNHQPISLFIISEAQVGGLLATGISWLGYKSNNPAFQGKKSLFEVGFRNSLLILPTLLMWPRGMVQQPVQLMIAIGLSILVLGTSYGDLSFYLPREDITLYNYRNPIMRK